MVARLIKDKGVIEFCEAAKELKEEGCKAEFCIVGALDPGNPSYIDQEKLNSYSKNNQAIFKGFSDNVLQELINCNLFVLPSMEKAFRLLLKHLLLSQL